MFKKPIIMKFLFWGLLLFFTTFSPLYAQKNKVKLCLHDNTKLSASFDLTYYWWDPYHIHVDGKILNPDGVKKEYYLKTDPPYDYCFMLNSGKQAFKVVSLFNDSIHFDLDLQKDETIIFQDYVKDYYKIASKSEKLIADLKFGDKLTVHFSKFINNEFEGLRIDLTVDEKGDAKVIAVNRKTLHSEKDLINYKNFNEAFNQIEDAAALLSKPSETGYVVTIRKNRLVKEYKGKADTAKIAQLFGKLKSCLNVKI